MHLVTKGLARASREDDERILATKDSIDGTFLFVAEGRVAEFLNQDFLRKAKP